MIVSLCLHVGDKVQRWFVGVAKRGDIKVGVSCLKQNEFKLRWVK